jgi:hypothetical protein
MYTTRFACAAAVAAAVLTATSGALAYPNTIIGKWLLEANVTASVTTNDLTIFQQSGGAVCQTIEGFITPHGKNTPQQPIQGYYCPTTGAVSFLRKNKLTNDTFQVFTGSLNASASSPMLMSGIFSAYTSSGAGEFPFAASQ